MPIIVKDFLSQNPSKVGWGPLSKDVPESLTSIPYAPFSKLDRLGKIADWTVPTNDHNADHHRSYNRRGGPNQRGNFSSGNLANDSNSTSVFNYQATTDEGFTAGGTSSSHSTSQKKSYGPHAIRYKVNAPATASFKSGAGRTTTNSGNVNGTTSSRAPNASTTGSTTRSKYINLRKRFNGQDHSERVRDASVKIGEDWKLMEEVDFGRLSKLSYDISEQSDVVNLDKEPVGELRYYDKTFDRVSTKMEKQVQRTDKSFTNPSTLEDAHLCKLAKQCDDHAIIATDSILAVIMCATKSVYPWDIQVTKEGKYVYLDKRDGGVLDRLTVHENAVDPPVEKGENENNSNPNTPTLLSQEATALQRHLLMQVLKDNEPLEFHHSAVFQKSNAVPTAYKYRQFDLGQDKKGNQLKLIARTQVHAAIHQPGLIASSNSLTAASYANPLNETLLANVYTMNEFEPKAGGAPEWRQKLDAQKGAVIAAEIKNNGNKMARWAVESVLSGVDQMKFGFVSRVSFRDRSRHVLLGMSSYKPKEFAAQMNLNLNNGWGILKAFADVFMDLNDGKYALVKDPNKGILRIYQVPESVAPSVQQKAAPTHPEEDDYVMEDEE